MIPVLGSMALAIGYTVVVGWIFKYAFLALSGKLYTLGQDMGPLVVCSMELLPDLEITAGLSSQFW